MVEVLLNIKGNVLESVIKMDKLKENIKKYVASKIVSILWLVIFIVVVLLIDIAFSAVMGNWVVLVALIVLIIFIFIDRVIDKQFAKWEAPELDYCEEAKLLKVDTIYKLFIGVIALIIMVFVLKWPFVLTLIIIAVIIIISEIAKWRKYTKQCPTPENGN